MKKVVIKVKEQASLSVQNDFESLEVSNASYRTLNLKSIIQPLGHDSLKGYCEVRDVIRVEQKIW